VAHHVWGLAACIDALGTVYPGGRP
jgi:hypothetical protein